MSFPQTAVIQEWGRDTGMEAVFGQEQEENGRVVKRVIAYTSKMLKVSQSYEQRATCSSDSCRVV